MVSCFSNYNLTVNACQTFCVPNASNEEGFFEAGDAGERQGSLRSHIRFFDRYSLETHPTGSGSRGCDCSVPSER